MHPIPHPCPAQSAHSTPRPAQPGSLPGTSCPTCAHSTCRTYRAQSLPRLGGHRSEFSAEHHKAAVLQAQHRGLIIFFGESTQSYWAASATGLTEARTWDELLAQPVGPDFPHPASGLSRFSGLPGPGRAAPAR